MKDAKAVRTIGDYRIYEKNLQFIVMRKSVNPVKYGVSGLSFSTQKDAEAWAKQKTGRI